MNTHKKRNPPIRNAYKYLTANLTMSSNCFDVRVSLKVNAKKLFMTNACKLLT